MFNVMFILNLVVLLSHLNNVTTGIYASNSDIHYKAQKTQSSQN